MFKKSWLCAPLATVALMGCATTPERFAPPSDCIGTVCRVQISVARDCSITTTPEKLTVRLPHGNKMIQWRIISRDFVFTHDGIVIKTPHQGVLHSPQLDGGGKVFIWHNNHKTSAQYEYGINVVGTGSNTTKCSKDPLIVNE